MSQLHEVREYIDRLIAEEEATQANVHKIVYNKEYFKKQGAKGGQKAKENNLAKDPDYYKKLALKAKEARKVKLNK
jgi:hypothetical protein